MSTKKIILLAVVIVVVLFGGLWLWRSCAPEPVSPLIRSTNDIGGPSPADMKRASEKDAERRAKEEEAAKLKMDNGTATNNPSTPPSGGT
jgi:hypothetical protein